MNEIEYTQPSHKMFEYSTTINTTLDQMIAFHQNPGALPALTPPPIVAQIKEDNRKSLTSGNLVFILWLGPIPIRWHARHEPGPTDSSFADVMVDGPMAHWRHEHIFEEVENGIRLTDRVRFSHKAGLRGFFTRLLFDGLPLRILFAYRHFRTKRRIANN